MKDQFEKRESEDKRNKRQALNSGSRMPGSKGYLFDNPRNVKILLRSFFASLLVLIIIEWFVDKDPHFPWEWWPEFYAVFGFVACVVLVLAAKYVLRPLVKRQEDYYD